jgi:ABC-type transport system involved in multi-copper enzyme maturation permease subunit
MLGLIVIAAFVVYFLIWVSVRAQLEAINSGQIPAPPGGTAQFEQTLQEIRPARVAGFGVSIVSGLGSVMLIVFAASHVGTEFGWGTFRTLLAHGASRGGFLTSKAVSLLLYAAVFMAVGTLAAIAASYLVSGVAGLSTAGIDLAEIAGVAAKSSYTFVPYMALALAIAVGSRSAGAGIATGLVVYFAESLVASVLISLNRDYAQIVNWGLSRNASALTRVTTSTGAGPEATLGTLPDPTRAAITLAAYAVVFLALAYWRLRSRDVTVGG